MNFIPTRFSDCWLIEPRVHRDGRGFFMETYSTATFAGHGVSTVFVQDNHARSATAGVLRGLHFQAPPHAQAKLLRVTAGAILDVVVDVRRSSPTFGVWEKFELSAENFRMLFVPAGFAHGYCTLCDDTEILYKVDALYAPHSEGGICWNCPDLNIPWPVTAPVLSAKDQKLPRLRDLQSPF
jgi:dTDP-4-dehydrorhamnose 3,5-epimerase